MHFDRVSQEFVINDVDRQVLIARDQDVRYPLKAADDLLEKTCRAESFLSGINDRTFAKDPNRETIEADVERHRAAIKAMREVIADSVVADISGVEAFLANQAGGNPE